MNQGSQGLSCWFIRAALGIQLIFNFAIQHCRRSNIVLTQVVFLHFIPKP